MIKVEKNGRRVVYVKRKRIKYPRKITLGEERKLKVRSVVISTKQRLAGKYFRMKLLETGFIACRKKQFYIDNGRGRYEDIELYEGHMGLEQGLEQP